MSNIQCKKMHLPAPDDLFYTDQERPAWSHKDNLAKVNRPSTGRLHKLE